MVDGSMVVSFASIALLFPSFLVYLQFTPSCHVGRHIGKAAGQCWSGHTEHVRPTPNMLKIASVLLVWLDVFIKQ